MKKTLAALSLSATFLFAPLVIGPTPAQAHDVVVKSEPGNGATVHQAPRELMLEFSGIPKDSFNTVALSKEDTGEVLFTATPQLDNQILRVSVPQDVTLTPGAYKVGFQITSSDGHATRGMTQFTLAEDSKNVGTTAPSGEFVPSSSENPYPNEVYLYGLIGIGLAVIALVVGAVVAISRKKK